MQGDSKYHNYCIYYCKRDNKTFIRNVKEKIVFYVSTVYTMTIIVSPMLEIESM